MNTIKHVAIIMDGNGRWGLKKNKSRNFGHQEGLKAVEKVINASIKHNIKSNSHQNFDIFIHKLGTSITSLHKPKNSIVSKLFISPTITKFNT